MLFSLHDSYNISILMYRSKGRQLSIYINMKVKGLGVYRDMESLDELLAELRGELVGDGVSVLLLIDWPMAAS